MSHVTPNGIDRLRGLVREQVRVEGLRPFALQIGVPVGYVRSLQGKRPVLGTTIESVADALGLTVSVDQSPMSNPATDVSSWAKRIRGDLTGLCTALEADHDSATAKVIEMPGTACSSEGQE